MLAKFYSTIEAIGKDTWDQLTHDNYPFTRYEFLHALESASDSDVAACCEESGWQAHHLLLIDDNDDQPIAAMPLYIKYHSFGEYIFDWAWADAYQRNGLSYYPKLLSAIPFTPCTGPRLISKGDTRSSEVIHYAKQAIHEEQNRLNLSSSHFLFTGEQVSKEFEDQSCLLRESVQYHWFNRKDNPYKDFKDFLNSFKSRKRKAINKERDQISSQGLRIKRLTGEHISPELWQRFYYFYQITYAKRSGHGGYLPQHFFSEIGHSMPDQIMMAVAFKDNTECDNKPENAIAAALFFYSEKCLYGRYWGCSREADFLHFELCYYQGLEFCIENNLQRFDAGAQGEHKIQRGFEPVKTYSCHSIANPQFHDAIGRFIRQEKLHNSAYIREVRENLPYKQTET